MTTNGVWVAIMNSESFSWKAVGRTEEETIKAIVNEWNNGVGCERRDYMTEEELVDYYGLQAEFLEFGKCEWY